MRFLLHPVHRRVSTGLLSWRQVLLFCIAATFLLQTYVTQTHFHTPSGIQSSIAWPSSHTKGKLAKQENSGPWRDRLPHNDDSAKCPLCQAVGYAGHFVTPSAAALLLPPNAISILPLAVAIVSTHETPSHIWQGRGPPNS